MKRFGIIAAVIVILLIGGAVAYMKFGAQQSPQTNAPVAQQKESEENSMVGTLKSLLSGGKNVTCSVSYTGEQESTGTVYVSDKKMAGDFTVTVEDKKMNSHMINDGEFVYVWSDDQTQGIKMSVTEVNVTPPPGQENQAVDLNKEANINCDTWAVDTGKFTPPVNVTFSDMTDLMMPKTSPSESMMEKTDTSVCDQITDPSAKTACEKAMQ